MISIKLAQPYDLEGTLYSGQSFRWNPVQEQTSQAPIWHEGIIHGQRIQLTSKITKGSICIKGDPDPYMQILVSDYLRLEDNLKMIYKDIESDNFVRNAIHKYKGLHLLRQDPWECLITFICSANNNIPRIKLLVESISKTAGTKLNSEGSEYFSFPTPTQLSELTESDLRDIGLGFRAKYVAKTTNIIFRNNINLLDMRKLPYDETLDFLNPYQEWEIRSPTVYCFSPLINLKHFRSTFGYNEYCENAICLLTKHMSQTQSFVPGLKTDLDHSLVMSTSIYFTVEDLRDLRFRGMKNPLNNLHSLFPTTT